MGEDDYAVFDGSRAEQLLDADQGRLLLRSEPAPRHDDQDGGESVRGERGEAPELLCNLLARPMRVCKQTDACLQAQAYR